MVLLVSTTQALFALDPDRRELFEIDRGRGVYYGIAYTADRLYVAARKSPYGVALPDRAAQRGVILEFDLHLRELRELEPPFPLRDLHQIHYGLGRLWVCSTHDDAVVTWDGRAWDRWFPAGVPTPRDTPEGPSPDLHHFNSICSDGRTIEVLANQGGTGTIHRFRAHDRAPLETIDLGRGAHNVWREGDDLFTLSSRDGLLLSTAGLEVPFGGFVRAVVCPPRDTGLDRFVGVSSRNTRAARGSGDSVLLRCDADWNVLDELPILGEGMIHDCRVPGTPDLGHPEHLGTPIDPRSFAGRIVPTPVPPGPIRLPSGEVPDPADRVDLHRA